MKAKTDKQIAAEIKALEKIKPRVLRYSGFGDDHHAAIDAQIVVLKERLTEDDLYTRQEDCEATECAGDDNINWSYENVFEAGCEAAQWLKGESEFKTLTENYSGLVDRDQSTVLRPNRNSILR